VYCVDAAPIKPPSDYVGPTVVELNHCDHRRDSQRWLVRLDGGDRPTQVAGPRAFTHLQTNKRTDTLRPHGQTLKQPECNFARTDVGSNAIANVDDGTNTNTSSTHAGIGRRALAFALVDSVTGRCLQSVLHENIPHHCGVGSAKKTMWGNHRTEKPACLGVAMVGCVAGRKEQLWVFEADVDPVDSEALLPAKFPHPM
jgi:hypothetical protein